MKAKKIGIAHLHWGFPPIIGGVETHLTILLPKLVQMGNRVSLLTGAVEGEKDHYDYKGVRVSRTSVMDLNWLYQRGLRGLEEELQVTFRDFIHESKPSVVHAHNMHYFSPVHISILQELCKEKGLPLILTAHNVWDDIQFLDLVRKVDWAQIIAVSHFIKREMIGVGVDDRKISVVHHGIDESAYRPGISVKTVLKKYPQLKGKRIIFHPARLGLTKGCDVSVKALNIVKEQFPDVLLILAGTKNIIDWGAVQQKDIAYVVNLIEFFGLRENTLVDAFKLADMPGLYAISDVCVYPSTSGEPFGLTMLEALSSAKPMIVTNSGGMPEIIKDGINGFVIPIKDFEVLASRITQLLTDDKLRKRFGYTGREMVEQSYTKAVMARNTMAVYRKVLQ